MNKLMHYLDRALSLFLIGLMSLLVLSVVWQVISRYLLADPSSVTEELARFLLIWLSLFGGAWAWRQRLHIGLNILTEKLRGRARLAAELFALLAAASFALLVLLDGGMRLVSITWELQQHSAAMDLPMATVYCALPMSGLLICIYTADSLWKLLSEQALQQSAAEMSIQQASNMAGTGG